MAEVLYEPKPRIIVYGPSKSGKSRSLATVPKGSKVYYVDVDRQAGEFLKQWKSIHGSQRNLKIVQIEPMKADTDNEAERIMNQIRAAVWSPPPGYDFYIIDSYTTLTLHLTHAIVGKGDRDYNQRNNADLSSWANDLWHQFVNATDPAWSITIMHEAWRTIEDGLSDPSDYRNKTQVLAPECATSARVSLPANCDFVWHAEKSRALVGKRTVSATLFRTDGSPFIMASSVGFSDVLKPLEPGNFGDLLKKMKLTHKKKGRK